MAIKYTCDWCQKKITKVNELLIGHSIKHYCINCYTRIEFVSRHTDDDESILELLSKAILITLWISLAVLVIIST